MLFKYSRTGFHKENPINYLYIQAQQQADAQLLARQDTYPTQYINKSLDDKVVDIICYAQPNEMLRYNGE